MIIAKRLKGKAIAAWVGTPGAAVRRAVDGVRTRLRGEPARLRFYYDIVDPWSYLTAQAVSRLIEAYPIDLEITTVTPPASDVDSFPDLRAKYAVRDAQMLAEYWDLEFAGKREADAGMVRDIGSALIKPRPAREQLACILELGGALWRTDRKKLTEAMGQWGTESHGSVAPILNTHYENLRKAGHYQGAMIEYRSTWYWGIDRLPYLEAQLAADLGTDVAHVVTPRPMNDRAPHKLSAKPLTLDVWFSFRSPYSYLALEQLGPLVERYRVPLTLKQVVPGVERGLKLPNVKRMYIVHDVKREADRLGIEFGEICDPLGTGVHNCLAIAHWANQQGKGLAFARSAMRATWAEARDLSAYTDLRFAVERAGLSWEGARSALDDPEAKKIAIDNGAELNGAGLWGVPSFRVGDFVAWGNDRIPLLADRLRRHDAAMS